MTFGPKRTSSLALWLRDKFIGLSKPKYLRSPALVVGLFVVITAFGLTATFTPAHAGLTSFLGLVIAWVMHYIVAFEGWLLIKMVGILIWVAGYNGFITTVPVVTGWFIVRDVVNMFFILMLLIIAFGTILGVDRYNYQKTLPALLMSAVLVNFSRTFCGIFIDISQVIMLTFVNGFSEAATGNFANAFRITQLMDTGKSPEGGDDALMMKLVAGWILAAALIGLSLVAVIYMTLILVFRIIFLWTLIILSPAAYFLRGIPLKAGEKFYGKWWDEFTKRLIAGPLMAFFLWLTLLTVAGGTAGGGVLKNGGFDTTSVGTGETNGVEIGLFSGTDLQAYIIGMAMLWAGMKYAQDFSDIKLSTVTGAPGSAWKSAKSALKSGQKSWDSASKTRVGQMLGRGNDSLKSGALALASKVPGMRSAAMRAQGELREKMAQKSAVKTGWQDKMSPEELTRYVKSGSRMPNALKTPERLGQERDALKRHMTNLVKGKGLPPLEPKRADESDTDFDKRSTAYNENVKKEYQSARNRLEKLGEVTHDGSIVESIKNTNKMRADLIVEDKLSETDPEKFKKQIKEQTESGRALGVKVLSEMDASAMVPQAMMHVNPKTMQKAMESMGQGQLDKLAKMGIKDGMDEKQIAQALNLLKGENARYLMDSDRKGLAKASREDLALSQREIDDGSDARVAAQQAKVTAAKAALDAAPEGDQRDKAEARYEKALAALDGVKDLKQTGEERRERALKSLAGLSKMDSMDAETLGTFAGAGGLGSKALGQALMDGAKVNPADLAAQGALASEVAKGMSGSDIAKLPEDLARVLRDAAAREGDVGKVLASGGSAKQAFGKFGYDDASGSMSGAGDFAQAFGQSKEWAGHVSADDLAKNGGVNDLSMAMVSDMDMNDVLAMGRGGNAAGARKLVESALAISEANVNAMVNNFEQQMRAGGMDETQASNAAADYGKRVTTAQTKAKGLLGQVRTTPSPLTAAYEGGVDARQQAAWQKQMDQQTETEERRRAEGQEEQEAMRLRSDRRAEYKKEMAEAKSRWRASRNKA